MIVPRVTSGNRKYIPIGYMDSSVICGDTCLMIPDASLYLFGIMESNVHMAWMKIICGRLKNDYRYSQIVYNNFPWPAPTDEQKKSIESTASGILHARQLYPQATLADLYNIMSMPPELRRAHQANDRAVMSAYGFPVKGFTEADCVAELMKMYQELAKR